jgi:hypothetical protein
MIENRECDIRLRLKGGMELYTSITCYQVSNILKLGRAYYTSLLWLETARQITYRSWAIQLKWKVGATKSYAQLYTIVRYIEKT